MGVESSTWFGSGDVSLLGFFCEGWAELLLFLGQG